MPHCLQVYKEGNLTTEKLREAAVAWKDVFEEIPIHVRNSPLATALMASIEPDTVADTKDFERLHLGVRPLLEKNLEFLNDCLDDIVAEQQKVCRIPCLMTQEKLIHKAAIFAGLHRTSRRAYFFQR